MSQNTSANGSDGSDEAAPAPENPLSQREMDVASQLVTGATNTEIARELVISPHTVKVHLRNIYEKLDVNSRTEASLVLMQNGWVHIPGVEALEPSEQTSAPEPVPEPEPLADFTYVPTAWQRVFLSVATVIVIVLLIAPVVSTGSSNPSFELLTDANRTVFGQAAPVTVPRWSARTPLPEARSRHAAALVDEVLYVLGGEDANGDTLDDATSYNMQTNRWQSLEPLPVRLENLAAAEWDGVIYVAGGSTNPFGDDGEPTISNVLYAYSTRPPEDDGADASGDGGGWQRMGDLPAPLAGAGLSSYDGALYLLGGWDGEHMRNEVWRAELGVNVGATLEWEQVAEMRIPAAFFGDVAVDGELFVIGGYDGQRELADAAVLDLTTYEWRDLPPLSVPRSGLSAVYDGMAVFALGGGWTRAVNTHERYDELAQQWSNFPSPYEGDWRHLAAASSDGRIWLIGGWSGGYLDTQQEYQSAFRALLPVIQND